MQSEKLYERILAYLKGKLSDRHRHDLEKEMMRDAFDEEAFEGLTQMSADDLEADMKFLEERLEHRTITYKKRILPLYWKVAAGILILAGIGTVIFISLEPPENKNISQQTNRISTDSNHIQQVPIEMRSDNGQLANNPTINPTEKSKSAIKPENQVSEEDNTEPSAIASEDVATENILTEESKNPVEAEAPLQEKKMTAASNAQAAPETRAAVNRAKKTSGGNFYKGKVADENGEPLPGVFITEKGTTNGTISDANGNFIIMLHDSVSGISLNYIGFNSVEIDPRKKSIDNIVMEPSLTALNEVVVVGYATQKKSEVTGSVARVDFDEDNTSAQSPVIKPVPPNGSVKEFKKWIVSQLDPSISKDISGKQKVVMELLIYRDGSIGGVTFKNEVDDTLAAEIKRVISQSPRWQPALRDNTPVDATVVIRFVAGDTE